MSFFYFFLNNVFFCFYFFFAMAVALRAVFVTSSVAAFPVEFLELGLLYSDGPP